MYSKSTEEEYVVRELYAEWCEEAIAAWLPPDWDSNRGTSGLKLLVLRATSRRT